MIGRRREASQQVLSAVDALDLELLPDLNLVLLTDLRRNDNLALGGDGGLNTR
jgi:hypothetical protein